MQSKYVPLKAVLNYIPDSVRQEETDGQLLSWAFQGYRENIRSENTKYSYLLCVGEIIDHKFKLPEGVIRISLACYSSIEPTRFLDSEDEQVQQFFITTHVNFANQEDKRILIYQSLVLPFFDKSFSPMRYVGQDADLVSNECFRIYDSECFINFSVSRDMRLITTDCKEGWVYVVYKTLIKDNKELIIPDDSLLLTGLGYFAEAQHWRNRASAKESSAEQMFQSRLALATQYFIDYSGTLKLRSHNASAYRDFIFGRFRMKELPVISGKNRNDVINRI